MKINQHIFVLALLAGATMGLTSCGDKFLDLPLAVTSFSKRI